MSLYEHTHDVTLCSIYVHAYVVHTFLPYSAHVHSVYHVSHLSACTHVYIHVYVHIHVDILVYIYIYRCVYTYTYAGKHRSQETTVNMLCLYMYVHSQIATYTYTDMYILASYLCDLL